MTLAYHRKSGKRQLTLLLAAFLAVVLGASALITSPATPGFANEPSGDGQVGTTSQDDDDNDDDKQKSDDDDDDGKKRDRDKQKSDDDDDDGKKRDRDKQKSDDDDDDGKKRDRDKQKSDDDDDDGKKKDRDKDRDKKPREPKERDLIVKKRDTKGVNPGDWTLYIKSADGSQVLASGTAQTKHTVTNSQSYLVAESGPEGYKFDKLVCTVDGQSLPLTSGPDAQGTATVTIPEKGGKPVVCEYKNKKLEQPKDREILVCKTVEDNEDAVEDGGEFRFDIRYDGEKQFDIGITAFETDTECKKVTVPAGAENVEVVEWVGVPADFQQADGYPQYSLDGGARVSSETAAVGGASRVDFYNKAVVVAPEVREILVCKTVEDNMDAVEDGGEFRFDIRYDGEKQFDIGITAFETDTECKKVTVPAGAENVEVVEWVGVPADFQQADGYPQYSLDGGDRVSGETAVVGGAERVDFFNKARPGDVLGTGILVIGKVNIGGDQGDVFKADVEGVANNVEFSAVDPAILPGLIVGDYTVTEHARDGYKILGWAVVYDQEVCPAEPQHTGATANVSVQDEQTALLCFYNEKKDIPVVDKKGKLTIKKETDVATGTKFPFVVHYDSKPFAEFQLGSGDKWSKHVKAGDYLIREVVPDGWTLHSVVCDGEPVTAVDGYYPVTVPAKHEVKCVFLNKKAEVVAPTGNLKIAKVNIGGDPADKFIANGHFIDPVEFSATSPATLTGLPVGPFQVMEQTREGYTILGWSVVDHGKTCPAEPQHSGNTASVTIAASKTTVVCFYNQQAEVVAPTGDLKIVKVNIGGDPKDVFKADVEGVSSNVAFSAADPALLLGLTPGAYKVTEHARDGYKILGWAVVEYGKSCPAAPQHTGASATVNVASGTTSVVCFYNKKVEVVAKTGTLVIGKVNIGGDRHDKFIANGHFIDPVQFSTAAPATLTGLPVGPLQVMEQTRAGYKILGWSVVKGGEVCPAHPQHTGAAATVNITAEHATVLCFYNKKVQPEVIAPRPPVKPKPVAPLPPRTGSGSAIGMSSDAPIYGMAVAGLLITMSGVAVMYVANRRRRA